MKKEKRKTRKKTDLSAPNRLKRLPACIGVIIDGNRRWAKERGLASWQGHEEGRKKVRALSEWAIDAGISHLIVYTFSTENWKRTKEEVGYLMELLAVALEEEMHWAKKKGIRLLIAGDKMRFSRDLQKRMAKVELETLKGAILTLVLALNYGGRAEILHAARKAAEEGAVTEEAMARHLYTVGIPDPDLIIRTGGAKRLSNFLPWQSIYSELFFVDTLWPDFSREEFEGILKEYEERERRFGK